MKSLLIAFVLCIVVAGCGKSGSSIPSVDSSSHRGTQSGDIVGALGDYGDHVWRGIPYAAAPVGDRRWRAPAAPAAWTGTREALAFGSPCVQFASKFGGVAGKDGTVVGSEDCLYLNVYAPRFAADQVPTGNKRLPVMVWIHGGGNSIGEAGFYDGGNLAATERVVVVTINYRLGPLGWFRHAALRDGATPAEQSGNFTTLDQIRALEWVRDNISAFGGNPQNVTIFGESAGGQNVYMLLLSPLANGLFQRAIVQSGGMWMDDLDAGENLTDAATPGKPNSSNEALVKLVQKSGAAADRAGATAKLARMSPAEVAQTLRGTSATALLSAYTTTPGTGMIEMPKVFADGIVLPSSDPMQHFAAGEYNRVPVMLGTNRDENKLFMFGDPQLVRKILWVVPRLRDERMYNLSAEYMAKMWKATGADEPAAAMRANQSDVYVYRFDWDEEPTKLGADLSVMIGASHGFEIPFVFGHFNLGSEGNVIFTDVNEPGRRALSRAMMGYWAEFARNGSPGRGGDRSLPPWGRWEPSSAQFAVLDTDAGGGIRMSTDSVTVERVVAAVDADPRLAESRDRCVVLHALAKWSRGFDERQYAAKAECQAFPFDRYPWAG